MSAEITVPRLGWSMEEGTFAGWLKRDGDVIKVGDALFTLETDKAAHDVDSVDAGVLRIPADGPKAGDIIKVGQVIGHLSEDKIQNTGEEVPRSTAPVEKTIAAVTPVESKPTGPTKVAVDQPARSSNPAKLVSSPRARRKANELGVDLTKIEGSGRGGRVRERDVLKLGSAKEKWNSPTHEPLESTDGELASLMRRSIAERTALSFSTIPHFYLRAEVDVTELLSMRGHLVDVVEKECGVRLTITDFILAAQARALRDFPDANAVWDDSRITRFENVDVGLVVGLQEGLLIPIIRAAQNLSLVELAKQRSRLVDAVRKGTYEVEMLFGGASSLSNLGTTRVDEFAAVIAPHQSTMLAVGRAAPRPYIVAGQLSVRQTLRLCLSVDHRVLDGGPAADFLGRLVELLETPRLLVQSETAR
jgi:pyruvate dehydrogenase E2 component (dihydrolipoamide acetyltransferase)